jgi:hypothetical protein
MTNPIRIGLVPFGSLKMVGVGICNKKNLKTSKLNVDAMILSILSVLSGRRGFLFATLALMFLIQ